jgi:hypothetical protein
MGVKIPKTIGGAIKKVVIWIILAIGGGFAYLIWDAAVEVADEDGYDEPEMHEGAK